MAKRTAPTRSVPGRPSRSSSPSAAVAYLRRSTDRQEQSLDDQRAAIERFAEDRGLAVLRWYVDDAISGTDVSRRRAFREMMADAASPARLFNTVLVYDIKRFGRVDNDEAGHYRWLLRRSGIAVVYVAEGFTGGTIDDLLRPVKQWQAREESRDLSKVTIRGMVSRIRRDAERGFWMGGFPPHGYDLRYESAEGRFRFRVRYNPDGSKLLLDDEGLEILTLKRREPHTVTKSDRCRLVPSTPVRVEVIRRIFVLAAEEGLTVDGVASRLNAEGTPTARGPQWSARCTGRWCSVTIANIVRNPVYMGDIVWNRRTLAKFHKISGDRAVERLDADLRRTMVNPVKDWIVSRGCHPALVGRGLWLAAQKSHRA